MGAFNTPTRRAAIEALRPTLTPVAIDPRKAPPVTTPPLPIRPTLDWRCTNHGGTVPSPNFCDECHREAYEARVEQQAADLVSVANELRDLIEASEQDVTDAGEFPEVYDALIKLDRVLTYYGIDSEDEGIAARKFGAVCQQEALPGTRRTD